VVRTADDPSGLSRRVHWYEVAPEGDAVNVTVSPTGTDNGAPLPEMTIDAIYDSVTRKTVAFVAAPRSIEILVLDGIGIDVSNTATELSVLEYGIRNTSTVVD
jgi:hypothetical protein